MAQRNIQAPIDRLVRPVSRFIHQEFNSAVVLFAAVVLAIVCVNTPLESLYHHFWENHFKLGFNDHVLDQPLHTWINDGLMAVFFFVIGLELKREVLSGELSSPRKALLPMGAALGGMLVPALIYTLFNGNTDASHGWGIPMATDIAFALALLSLAGNNIPTSVKVFLSALAVADDLGAIIVIALFYSSAIDLLPLSIAAGFLLVLVAGNYLGIRHAMFYLIIGFGVWVCFLLSGVHATIAGVLVAFTIPARSVVDEIHYSSALKKLSHVFEKEIPTNNSLTTPKQNETIQTIKKVSSDAETPLQKIEYTLHPWVAFVIMPLFALANAGMIIGSDFFQALLNPVSLGVSIGLVAGKFIGVLGFTWLLIKLRIASMPRNARWKHLTGVALLAGVGFTMSLFITGLAFRSAELVNEAKYGILLASLIAGAAGTIVLRKMRAAR